MAYSTTRHFIVHDQSKTEGGVILPLFHRLVINAIVVHHCVIVGKQCVLAKIIRKLTNWFNFPKFDEKFAMDKLMFRL